MKWRFEKGCDAEEHNASNRRGKETRTMLDDVWFVPVIWARAQGRGGRKGGWRKKNSTIKYAHLLWISKFLFRFPVRQMESVIQAVECPYYCRCQNVLSDKLKHGFSPFLPQQERGCRSGSRSSCASLSSASIFTIFSSTCAWNTCPQWLLGSVSRSPSLPWTSLL